MTFWNKYANTAARKHGKPGREARPKSLTVDMHAHVAVPRVAEIVTPHLNPREMGGRATAMLARLLSGQAADAVELVPVELVPRASTARLG